MTESSDQIETANSINDAIADIERACRSLADHDHLLDTGVSAMGDSIYDSAKQLSKTAFQLNHLRQIYDDAIISITHTVSSQEESDDLMETVKKIEKSVASGSSVFHQLNEEADIQSKLPTEFPSLNSLRSVLKVKSSYRPGPRSRRAGNESSQELEMLEDESESVLIDPVSKKPIERPVRNIRCKHVYDKVSITNFISSASNPRCPTMGCMNREPLSARMLEEVNWTPDTC